MLSVSRLLKGVTVCKRRFDVVDSAVMSYSFVYSATPLASDLLTTSHLRLAPMLSKTLLHGKRQATMKLTPTSTYVQYSRTETIPPAAR